MVSSGTSDDQKHGVPISASVPVRAFRGVEFPRPGPLSLVKGPVGRGELDRKG